MSDQQGSAAGGDVPQNTQDLTVFVSTSFTRIQSIIELKSDICRSGPKLVAANGANALQIVAFL
jgi:hypothetical protein